MFKIKNKKLQKKIFKYIGAILALLVITLGGYLGYLSIQYYRIDDYTEIVAENPMDKVLTTGTEVSAVTYNIGFGAYNEEFSFFMDSGEMLDGTLVSGKYSKAKSEDVVLENTKGAIESVKDFNADFYLFQEVDTHSTRSFKVNQYNMLKEIGSDYSLSFASNFHSAYLLYPFNDPHGASNAGLTTMSKYNVDTSIRRQYPIDNSFITKFTDLDRCFLITRVPVDNGKELVVINNHMSAYDKGGNIREQQVELLNEVLREEEKKGNYVIVGGDFNHDIANSKEAFKSNQKTPEWVYSLDDSSLTEGYSFAIAENKDEVATCRSTDIPYENGENYLVIIDGFIVSNNIKDIKVENIETGYKYSDHNPVKISFTLE